MLKAELGVSSSNVTMVVMAFPGYMFSVVLHRLLDFISLQNFYILFMYFVSHLFCGFFKVKKYFIRTEPSIQLDL